MTHVDPEMRVRRRSGLPIALVSLAVLFGSLPSSANSRGGGLDRGGGRGLGSSWSVDRLRQ